MKKQSNLAKQALVLATGVALAAGSSLALAVTQNLGGQVTIQPRDITTQFTNRIDFGNIKVGSEGGHILLSHDSSNTISVDGDVVHVDGGYEGRLGIKGEKDHIVTVMVDSSFIVKAQNRTDAENMTVTTSHQSDSYTLRASNGEWNYVHIGGTLTIPANQPADSYRGSFSATVNYQ